MTTQIDNLERLTPDNTAVWLSIIQTTLTLGGIGNNRSRHYRGEFGFRELTHARSVVALAQPFGSVAAVNSHT